MTRGRTRTHDQANGLPFSNQLSYQVIRQLSCWVRVRLSCQGSSWSRYQAGMFDGESVASAKHKVHKAQMFNVLQTWPFNPVHPYTWNKFFKVFYVQRRSKQAVSPCGGTETTFTTLACSRFDLIQCRKCIASVWSMAIYTSTNKLALSSGSAAWISNSGDEVRFVLRVVLPDRLWELQCCVCRRKSSFTDYRKCACVNVRISAGRSHTVKTKCGFS